MQRKKFFQSLIGLALAGAGLAAQAQNKPLEWVIGYPAGGGSDVVAREVQAAINAARSQLPTSLPGNPTYRKVNPADSPILIVALTSSTLTRPQMYDAASTVLAQRLAQVEGVGQVSIGGSSLPAVRVELDPDRLAASGLNLDDVRGVIVATNANRPKGVLYVFMPPR